NGESSSAEPPASRSSSNGELGAEGAEQAPTLPSIAATFPWIDALEQSRSDSAARIAQLERELREAREKLAAATIASSLTTSPPTAPRRKASVGADSSSPAHTPGSSPVLGSRDRDSGSSSSSSAAAQ